MISEWNGGGSGGDFFASRWLPGCVQSTIDARNKKTASDRETFHVSYAMANPRGIRRDLPRNMLLGPQRNYESVRREKKKKRSDEILKSSFERGSVVLKGIKGASAYGLQCVTRKRAGSSIGESSLRLPQ